MVGRTGFSPRLPPKNVEEFILAERSERLDYRGMASGEARCLSLEDAG